MKAFLVFFFLVFYNQQELKKSYSEALSEGQCFFDAFLKGLLSSELALASPPGGY